MKRLCGVLFLALVFSLSTYITTAKGAEEVITKGKKVKFNYILTVDGKVFDSSEKTGGPLEYVQGDGSIIKGLERQLDGLKAGDKRTIIVSPDEAYGNVDPKAFKEVSKSELPKELVPSVGQILQVRNAEGQAFNAVVSEIKENSVVLNFNHILAGKELKFEITILSVQ
ncbi:MAG: peptidylprolyl isomerase [Candidatus Omnitrophica bacterium]|nr:peptidylprolyl isomerase [Candidatus Omnitrophota bacterium]MDD5352832.1 peptidylprolyl isomerase [Candidatus Omnitrophota bacterium]MDD5550431.1 peptidylprolyl isomerase [Candidatus Omnitrophota bacterium]